jgi:hypothetical protein
VAAALGDDFVDRLLRQLDARIAELAQDADRLERAKRTLCADRLADIDYTARISGDDATKTTGGGGGSAEAKPASREARPTPTPTRDVGGESIGVSRAVAALRAALDAGLRSGR